MEEAQLNVSFTNQVHSSLLTDVKH